MNKPLIAALLLLTTAATLPLVGQAAPDASVPADRGRRCGLGKDFHAGRRAELRRRLESGWVLVRGLPETRDYTEFRQDKTFWYLTGIESPNATLVMNVETGAEMLFLPEHNKRKEFWDGELWDASDDWVTELTGFEDVRSESELMDVLGEAFADRPTVWISMHPYIGLSGGYDRAEPADRHQAKDPLDGRVSREKALAEKLLEHFDVEAQDMRETLAEMRWIKTTEELEAMRRASLIGCEAMREAIRSTRPNLGEWDLDALMSWLFIRKGAEGPGYYAIVGGGRNSCVLHYSASSGVMKDGDVVLIDYAPEYNHYVSDITRTWPVNGRFTELQAKLYDAVLEAQEASLAAIKPGVTLREVGQAARDVLDRHELRLPHGVSHWIGMEVHDVAGPKSFDRKLVPGVVFTVEPGYYDEKTGIGIRIEDVVAVTEDGYENFSGSLTRDRAELEALVQSVGILDTVDGHLAPGDHTSHAHAE